MYNQNSDHKSGLPMSPRISFSNDFAESAQYSRQQQQLIKPRDTHGPPPPPVSSDFEFSVSNYSMISADELFCKGRLLPFKNNFPAGGGQKTTLRDELLAGEDEHDGVSFRPPKGSSSSAKWKGFLGLRKSHIGSKKSDKMDDGSLEKNGNITKTSSSQEEMMNEGGGSSSSSSNCRDVEFRMH